MKNISKTIGGIVFATLLVFSMSGCATQNNIDGSLSVEESASLYLTYVGKTGKDNSWLESIDGVPMKGKWSFNNMKQKVIGHNQSKNLSARIQPGEHTVVISIPNPAPFGFGRKSYETTYNFEAGKRYEVKAYVDPSKGFAEQAADALKGEYVLIITDMDANKTEINIDLSGGLTF